MTPEAAEAEGSALVLRDDAEGVATLRLNRPGAYNASSSAMCSARISASDRAL